MTEMQVVVNVGVRRINWGVVIVGFRVCLECGKKMASWHIHVRAECEQYKKVKS